MRTAITVNVMWVSEKHFDTPFIWKVITHRLFLQECMYLSAVFSFCPHLHDSGWWSTTLKYVSQVL